MDELKANLPILAPIIGLQLILLIAALIDLGRREAERVKGPKWVWVLVCLFGSMLGSIAYFVFGRKE